MKKIVYASSLHGLEILSCSNDHQFSKHLHDGYVLWLNSESGEYFSLNGTSDILQPGAISIIEPGVIHSNRPCVPKQRHLRSFYFSEKFLKNLSTQFSNNGSYSLIPTCSIQDRHLWSEFAVLHETLLHSEDSLSMEVEIISTFSKLYELCSHRSTLPGNATKESRVNTVIDYFCDNIDRQFYLGELAELVQCTSYHLIRLFQREKGLAPHKFLIQLRLEKARKLLNKGAAIVDAALLSGFSDQSHLTRMFKARYGVTPGLYQKQLNLL